MNHPSQQLLQAIGSRTLIIGNSGSGKSTLGQGIGSVFGIPVFDLDLFHWEDGQKRDADSAIEMTQKAGIGTRWVIEGVFGWLAAVVIERATALIWTDLQWEDCKQGLVTRGHRRGHTQTEFVDLVAWAEAYWERDTQTSFKGHLRLYDDFPSTKLRLRSRAEIEELISILSDAVRRSTARSRSQGPQG